MTGSINSTAEHEVHFLNVSHCHPMEDDDPANVFVMIHILVTQNNFPGWKFGSLQGWDGLQHKYRQLSFMGELPWMVYTYSVSCCFFLCSDTLFWDTTKGNAVLHIILSSQRFALEGPFGKISVNDSAFHHFHINDVNFNSCEINSPLKISPLVHRQSYSSLSLSS